MTDRFAPQRLNVPTTDQRLNVPSANQGHDRPYHLGLNTPHSGSTQYLRRRPTWNAGRSEPTAPSRLGAPLNTGRAARPLGEVHARAEVPDR